MPADRLRRTLALLSLAILVFAGFALTGCDGPVAPGGESQSGLDPAPGALPPGPGTLSRLLPKPVLPELRVIGVDRPISGVRAGYSWARDGRAIHLEELWPPPDTSGAIPVSPGENVTFEISLPPGSPEEVLGRKQPAHALLEAWYYHSASGIDEPSPVYYGTCEEVDENEAGGSGAVARFSWQVPEVLGRAARDPGGNSFVVRLAVAWGDPGVAARGGAGLQAARPGSGASGTAGDAASSAPSSPWVSYYWGLFVVDKDALGDILDVGRRYLNAIWAGDAEDRKSVV